MDTFLVAVFVAIILLAKPFFTFICILQDYANQNGNGGEHG